jgi:hypothetical protein
MAVFSPAQGSQPVLMFSDQNYLGATDSDFEITDQVRKRSTVTGCFHAQPGQFVEVPVKNWIAAELTAMVQYKLARKLSASDRSGGVTDGQKQYLTAELYGQCNPSTRQKCAELTGVAGRTSRQKV